MKIDNIELFRNYLGMSDTDLANKRLLCRVYSLLYMNHWYRNPSGDWEYIGKFSSATALWRVHAGLNKTDMRAEIQDENQWVDMEGSERYIKGFEWEFEKGVAEAENIIRVDV